jgi:hypothetical protein
VIYVIRITKQEALELNKKYKVPFGENGISHTYSGRHHKYYLCEVARNLRNYSKVHDSKITHVRGD